MVSQKSIVKEFKLSIFCSERLNRLELETTEAPTPPISGGYAVQFGAAGSEAEAKAGWFTSSWRPLLRYVLITILVWNYIFSPIISVLFGVKASVDMPSEVTNLLTVGVGGYTIGRSAESVAKSLAARPVQSKDQENG